MPEGPTEVKTRWTALRKSGYASVETGVTAFELFLQVYLIEFYIVNLGLHPLLASAGAAVAVFWDAITDPVVGILSDQQSASRYGKRWKFIAIGAMGLALFGVALFRPPDTDSQGVLFGWYLVSYLAVNTSMSFVTIPHLACIGDYTRDSAERNSFFGWRLLFANFGLLLGIILPSQLADASSRSGRSESSFWFAIVLLLGVLTFIRSNRGVVAIRPVERKPTLRTSFSSLTRVLRNRYFLPLLGAFALAAVARAINSGIALFYYKDALLLDEKTQVSLILSVFIVSIIASIPLWLLLGKIFWKKQPAFWGVAALGVLTCCTYPFFPAGQLTGPLIMALMGGIAVGSVLLIESMVLDAVDAQSGEVGTRPDGAYFGCWKLTTKTARAVGILLTGPVLIWTGYDNALEIQSPETTEKIAAVFGYLVGFFFLASAWVLKSCKLDKIQPTSG